MKRNKENRSLIIKCAVLGFMLLLIVYAFILLAHKFFDEKD